MYRSLLPFILASFGYIMLLQADGMLLFEWQISETVTDSQSTYEVYFLPSYHKSPFGKSLGDSSLYFTRSSMSDGRSSCLLKNLKFVVRRSQNDETLERISLGIYNSVLWLFRWGWIGIILSVIYMWWFMLWYKHATALDTVIFIGIVVFICILLSPVVRIVGPNIGYVSEIYAPPDCQGTITFDAVLVKIHYEMPIVLLAGICLELGALSVMFRQIKRFAIERKDSLNHQ